MKRVLSVSLGSSRRDHTVEIELSGIKVRIERRGVDGDFAKARQTFLENDDAVDAFGIGGAELGINIGNKYHRLRSVKKLVADLKTPVTDGSGVRSVIEGNCAKWLQGEMKQRDAIEAIDPRRAFFCVGTGRYDLVAGFHEQNFKLKFGDAGFILGLPITTSNFGLAKFVAQFWTPMIVQAPFKWLYPTGKSQEQSRPKFDRWYQWATVIADDFHYIKKHLPERIDGKVIVTNTTTDADVELLHERGASWLCTTTPRFNGRSFGTNVLEAALTAVGDHGRSLTNDEVGVLVAENSLSPTLKKL